MPSPDSESPDEGYFNDLTQQAPDANGTRQSPTRTNSQDAQNDISAKQKRIACVLCRKRKLRCDGARPTCGTCKRLSHDCAYDEARKKSGPKRGYVKLLEQRLQQVETLLKTQDSPETNRDAPRHDTTTAYVANTIQQAVPTTRAHFSNPSDKSLENLLDAQKPSIPAYPNETRNANGEEPEYSWEMIGLGLEEPLPPGDVMEELYQIYFTKIHPSLPFIHQARFMAALNLAPHMRPPVSLRYIMWTLAASVADKYDALQEQFYHRARKYAQLDEMRGHGESTITLAHCQAWVLTSTYEFKNMYFPRAWLSAGRAVRLAQMMQLHRLDGTGLDVKQCLPPPKDWTEREERRRTFWMCFAVDRYASIGTGWPMTIDERDIMTNLPASEDAFERSKAMSTGSLEQVLNSNGAADLQAFGGIVFTAAMFGRNLLHLHRPTPNDNDSDINGEFWNRHRQIEQILLTTSLSLPDHLRLPNGLNDPNVVFANMCLHTSIICLHQAAIFKADKYRLPVSVGNESKVRCVTAAAEIASIMRMISHMDLGVMSPFMSFCVYVAARVFVQYLKTRPKDQQMNSSLQFLLQAMHALRRKNPLTESFLVQLDLDLDSAGISKPYTPAQKKNSVIPVNTDPVGCSSIYEIRETQAPNAPINQYANSRASSSCTRTPFVGDEHQMASFGTENVINMDMEPRAVPFDTVQNLQQDVTNGFTPHRGGPPGSTTFLFPKDANDMEMSGDQPSPSTINSQSQTRSGSTRHSSYSPNQQTEHRIPYRASPRATSQQIPQMPLPHSGSTASAPLAPLYPASGDMLMNGFPEQTLNNGNFPNSYDWEFSAMDPMSMPMSDGNWNQMIDSMTMGWDGLTPNIDVSGSGDGVH